MQEPDLFPFLPASRQVTQSGAQRGSTHHLRLARTPHLHPFPKDFRLCEGPKGWVLKAADWVGGVWRAGLREKPQTRRRRQLVEGNGPGEVGRHRLRGRGIESLQRS